MKKQYVCKGGETFWAQTDVSVVHDELQNPKYFIAHIQDITERLRAEERVRQSQKMEAVGQLTAGIAHDFNNILATVIGNLEMLNEGFADDPAEAREFSMSALDGALSAAGLVRSLLAFSRQQPLRPQATCIRTAVTRMETLLRVSLGARIEIRIVVAADLWQAMVDVAQIESALLNLAINARDAMPNGGVLTLDAANVHVSGGAFPAADDLQAGDYVVLSVTDSGAGMAPEVIKRAFEPFFSTKGVGGGSGLGLSMVMGTMQQQGGAVRIDSELGRGTIVQLFLPCAFVIAETPADQASAPACLTEKERILFVEDKEQVR
jgi:signal transduction histidine kinase